MGKVVAFVLIGEIKFDGRVQKEIRSLQTLGYKIVLIVSSFINDSKENYDFEIYNCNYKTIKGKPYKNLYSRFAFCKEAFEHLKIISPEIVHCNDLNTLYSGYLYKKFKKDVKIIYDAHELFPESQSSFIRRLFWNMVEKRLIKYSDEVISPEINRAKYMKNKYKLKKVHVIENFPEEVQLSNINYIELQEKGTINKHKCLYLGMISPKREIDKLILSMKYTNKDVCLVLIGKVSDNQYKRSLLQIIEKNNLQDKVFFIPPVENKMVIHYINSSDIGLIFYKNNNLNNYYCASNKLYEFINCNKKVITNNYPGLISVVEENDLGLCLKSVNEISISEAINSLLKLDCYNKIYDNRVKYLWNFQEKRFLEIYI